MPQMTYYIEKSLSMSRTLRNAKIASEDLDLLREHDKLTCKAVASWLGSGSRKRRGPPLLLLAPPASSALCLEYCSSNRFSELNHLTCLSMQRTKGLLVQKLDAINNVCTPIEVVQRSDSMLEQLLDFLLLGKTAMLALSMAMHCPQSKRCQDARSGEV